MAMDQKAREALKKIDSCCDGRELVRISKQRVGENKEVIGVSCLNPILDWLFRGCSGMGESPKKPSFLKICHANPTMMNPDTVVAYLKKIQKKYKSRDAPLEFC